jgi:hypothetical protein
MRVEVPRLPYRVAMVPLPCVVHVGHGRRRGVPGKGRNPISGDTEIAILRRGSGSYGKRDWKGMGGPREVGGACLLSCTSAILGAQAGRHATTPAEGTAA